MAAAAADQQENAVVVQHAVFRTAVEVPMATLPRIIAPVDLHEVLTAAGVGPPRGKWMVVTVVRVEEESVTQAVNYIVSNVARPKRICVPANLVHPEAPPDFRIVVKQDYSGFIFPPNDNQSDWLQASRLGATFYSSFGPSVATQIRVTENEKTRFGLTDFQIRLVLSPAEDPRLVIPLIVAIPVPTAALDGLLSPHLAKQGRGYPVLLISREDAITVGPRPARVDQDEPFGLPAYPVLWFPTPGGDPQPADVLTSVLGLWGTSTAPRLVESELWTNASATNPVVANEIPAVHRWPMVQRIQQDNFEGRFQLNAGCVNVDCYHPCWLGSKC